MWAYFFQGAVLQAAGHAFWVCDWRVETCMENDRHSITNATLYTAAMVGSGERVTFASGTPLVGVGLGWQFPVVRGISHDKRGCRGNGQHSVGQPCVETVKDRIPYTGRYPFNDALYLESLS